MFLRFCALLNVWFLSSPDVAILHSGLVLEDITGRMCCDLHKQIVLGLVHRFVTFRGLLRRCTVFTILKRALRIVSIGVRECRTPLIQALHVCRIYCLVTFVVMMVFGALGVSLDMIQNPRNNKVDFTDFFATSPLNTRQYPTNAYAMTGRESPTMDWNTTDVDISGSKTALNRIICLSQGCQMITEAPLQPHAFMGTACADGTKVQPMSDLMRNHAIDQAALAAIQTTNPETVRIICDSGASLSCVGNQVEFETLTKHVTPTELKGIAAGLEIKGEGTVRYDVHDETGTVIQLVAKAYWVPQLKNTRLLSPQSLSTTTGEIVTLLCHGELPQGISSFAELQVRPHSTDWQRNPPSQRIIIPYHPGTNLPEIRGILPSERQRQMFALTGALHVTDESNRNLTASQKELLKWHYRLGHVGFQWLQWLIRSGRVAVGNKSAVSNCQPPKCAACEYGKAIRRNTEATLTEPRDEKEMELKKDDLIPGQRISVDHYQSATPGRLYTSRGSTQNSNKFHGGAIFVDHASGKVSVRHQISLSSSDTIKAKLHFERDAYEDGVIIQSYHTNNGVFTSEQFMTDLLEHKQTIRFSGSGAAHQNGVAERAIRTVVTMARTMMIHAAMRTSDGSLNTELWPMAMDYATWIYNHIPRRDSGASPEELWTRTTSDTPVLLSDCHVWGCPVFVLEPKLQKTGIKIPKWHPRSRRGVYMGFSTHHSTLVALILDLATRTITPQFHLVFDDMFHTVVSSYEDPPC